MKKIFLTLLTLVSLSHAENIYATFNVAAQKSANLAFTASGIVQKVHVDIGSVVKENQILASLDNADIKAMLQKTKIVLKFASRELERQKKIKNLIDASKYDKVLSNYENAKASVAYQQALYEKTILKAPFEGIIYDKEIEIGDAVSGMMLKTVFKIQSLHARKLILEFDQKYHHIVKVGQTFEYKVDGDDKTYTGVISKVYPYANFDNRKIKAEVKAKDFTVGLFGDGYILVDGK
ncbi:efflux RND transporter periplasmic adaptor subunit [Sulfurimonas autotrophica]|uniref:Efflux system, membrane fusion protein n=1 Tax=Sulfurimonas autotrophica (strain ATCC BAA-671 / DSM 16294 / JCM 11897 / OK10) TaxID=563040 RepID=E0UTK3_SULAO|nr:efflux RND transporter periplasmic adaptor subunit [Sulfurimonas autotrophica]ADN09368.1 efflux system, membrane fusion protein [Sulfurimonas autotrophica DSM 16294]